MKLCSCKPHVVTLCFLTASAVSIVFYAMLFGHFVDKEMNRGARTSQHQTAQELFDAESPFTEKLQDGPQSAPSSHGPSYPPPRP